jgi:hypothetical protein
MLEGSGEMQIQLYNLRIGEGLTFHFFEGYTIF